jgi:hypothetical protein
MKKRIVQFCGASALTLAAAANVASASAYYQTTGFQSSNASSNASSDFVNGVQFGEAPGDATNSGATNLPTYSSSGVTLAGTSNRCVSMGLIDTYGVGATGNGATGTGAGIYADTNAVLNFSLVQVGNTAYTTFGIGERAKGNGTNGALVTNEANTYPAYVVSYDLGTLSLDQSSTYTSGGGSYGATLATQTGITLGSSDSYQLEMITTGATSPMVTAILTDTTTDTVLADISATGGLTDTQGSVGFWGGSDGNGDYNTLHGIDATAFSVNAPAATPEPSTIGLVAMAVSGLLIIRRRRAM